MNGGSAIIHAVDVDKKLRAKQRPVALLFSGDIPATHCGNALACVTKVSTRSAHVLSATKKPCVRNKVIGELSSVTLPQTRTSHVKRLLPLMLLAVSWASSATITFDSSFSSDGVVTFFDADNICGSENGATMPFTADVKVDPANRTLIAGSCQIILNANWTVHAFVARLSPDGSLDQNFGIGGVVRFEFVPGKGGAVNAMHIYPNGKILLAGDSAPDFVGPKLVMAAARLNVDGSFDTSFGPKADGRAFAEFSSLGMPTVYGDAVVVDSKNRIYIAGTGFPAATGARIAVAKLNANGVLDTTYGQGGRSFAAAPRYRKFMTTDVDVQSDDRVLVSALDENMVIPNVPWTPDYRAGIVRFNTDGSLDHTFGTQGYVSQGVPGSNQVYPNAMAVANNRIIIAGNTYHDLALMKFLPDGTLDTNFDLDGVRVDSLLPDYAFAGINDVAVTPGTNSIVIAGRILNMNGPSLQDFIVARYSAAGALDPSYGSGPSGTLLVEAAANGMAEFTGVTLSSFPTLRLTAFGREEAVLQPDLSSMKIMRWNTN